MRKYVYSLTLICLFGRSLAVTCDSTVTYTINSGDHQVISSPNYPISYPTGVTQCWQFRTSSSYNLRAYINSLSTENTYDYVSIYDDSTDTYSNRRVKASGTGGSYDSYSVTTTSQSGGYNYMYVVFHSDSSIVNNGFELCVYRSSDGRSGCDFYSSSSSSSSSINLSGASIAGICFGSFMLVMIVTILVCCLVKKGTCKTTSKTTTAAATVRVAYVPRSTTRVQPTPAPQPPPQQPAPLPPLRQPQPPPQQPQPPPPYQSNYPPNQPYPPPSVYPPPAYDDAAYPPPPAPPSYMPPPAN